MCFFFSPLKGMNKNSTFWVVLRPQFFPPFPQNASSWRRPWTRKPMTRPLLLQFSLRWFFLFHLISLFTKWYNIEFLKTSKNSDLKVRCYKSMSQVPFNQSLPLQNASRCRSVPRTFPRMALRATPTLKPCRRHFLKPLVSRSITSRAQCSYFFWGDHI